MSVNLKELRSIIAGCKHRIAAITLADSYRDRTEFLAAEFNRLADVVDHLIQVVGDIAAMTGGAALPVALPSDQSTDQSNRVPGSGPQGLSPSGMSDGRSNGKATTNVKPLAGQKKRPPRRR